MYDTGINKANMSFIQIEAKITGGDADSSFFYIKNLNIVMPMEIKMGNLTDIYLIWIYGKAFI